MADVWVSLGRKFCEVCKVWYGNNKASQEHHERGQRHKAALDLKLRELGKKNKQKEHQQATLNSHLAQMEMAAFSSMQKNDEGVEHGPMLPGGRLNYFDPSKFTDVTAIAHDMAAKKAGKEPPSSANKMHMGSMKGQPSSALGSSSSGGGPIRRGGGGNSGGGGGNFFSNPDAGFRGSSTACEEAMFVPGEYVEGGASGPGLSRKQRRATQKESVAKLAVIDAAHESIFDGREWVEADAGRPDGKKYYFHMFSGETTWELPERVISASEYEEKVPLLEQVYEHNRKPPPTTQQQKTVKEEAKETSPAVKDEPPEEDGAIASSSAADIDLMDIPMPDTEDIPLPAMPPGPPPAEPSTSEAEKNDNLEDEDATSNVKSEPETEEAEDEQPPLPVLKATPFGAWTRVKKQENVEAYCSPVTEKFREQERKEELERERMEQKKAEYEEQMDEKLDFAEKVATVTKKVKGPIEFKKRATTKNIRKREED